jgi:cytoskeleton protein RodZ
MFRSIPSMTETIGQQLKQARKAKNLTLQKVVQATHMRANQIEAIEADDFEAFASPVQARAYLRLYIEFLGLSLDELITQQRGIADEISGVLKDSKQGPIKISKSIDEMAEESIPVEVQKLENKRELLPILKNGLLAAFTRIFHRSKLPSTPVEPVQTGDLLEASEIENEEETPPAEIPAKPHEIFPSQLIFITIGKTLRERRESLSLTLEEIERHIHVRNHYLEALEAGEFSQLPSSVQARGMLNNYAHFLDLDVDALLLTFAEGLQTQRLERQPILETSAQTPVSKGKVKTSQALKFKIPATIRRYFSVDVFVGGGLVILLLAFAVWGTSRIINLRTDSTPQSTVPPISNVLISTPEAETISPTSTATGNESNITFPAAGETLVMTLPAARSGAVQVVIVANEQAWVRVTVDGKIVFEGRVSAGSAYPFDGNTQIEVLTGNGRAISILYNQNNLGPMGNTGEVVDRIYTTNAILNPTATFTTTPTITQTPTVTRRPTLTLRPTLTPRPSSTPVK